MQYVISYAQIIGQVVRSRREQVVTRLDASSALGAIYIIDAMSRRLDHLSKRNDDRLTEMNKAIHERKLMEIELEQTKAALAVATAPPPRRLPLP